MNAKQFYDWQTSGGVNDVMLLVECLERETLPDNLKSQIEAPRT